MIGLPDFEALAMFARVAEEGSYVAAARGLGVSVATVSRAVSRLEDQFGGRLINRNSRRLALTDLGEGFAERAARLLADAQEIEREASETARRPRGVIKLAAPMSFGIRWVAPLLPAFFEAHPDIQIDLHLGDEQVDLIGAGFDAALRISVPDDSSLVVRQLAPVRRFVVAAPSYLARYGRPTRPDELIADHCLGYAYRAHGDVWRFTNAAGESAVATPTGPLRSNNAEALLPIVLAGHAIAELPEFLVFEHLQSGQVKALLPDWSMALGGLYLTTPTARARSARMTALASFLTEQLSRPSWSLL